MMASKFATGASVSKTAAGEEEIVIQGDVGDEVVEMLRAQVKELKGAPADQVVRVSLQLPRASRAVADTQVEDKKKRAAEAEA